MCVLKWCLFGHEIGGFRASEGLSKKHECLSQEYFIMQIMDIKIKKLLLTLQKPQAAQAKVESCA